MIIITGGAGFIGSLLAHELNKKGREDIIIVDRLESDEKWKNLLGLHFDRYIHADKLFDSNNLKFLKKAETIYHMGACSSTTEKNIDFLMCNNVEYTKLLFKYAAEYEVPFIYASSAATYGNGDQGYDDNHEKIKNLRPLNPYGFSKHLVDLWALKQNQTPPVWFGLKFFNVYGPFENHKEDMRSLVNKAFHQINENGVVKLFRSHKDGFQDGEQLRDFVYGKDICRAMLELSSLTNGSGIYNMGTGQARSFYDLVNETFRAMEVKPNIEFIDMPLQIRDQYQYFTQANMNKFQKLIPNHKWSSLADGVHDYVVNYLMKK